MGQVPQNQGVEPAGMGQLQAGISTVTMEVRGQVELAGGPSLGCLRRKDPSGFLSPGIWRKWLDFR